MARASSYDCTACGACCCNVDQNREQGLVNYVEVEARDRIRKNPELMRKLTVLDEDGIPHMRLDARQRCSALRGVLGKQVTCTIYEWRPSGCRRVMPGDDECKKARRERGLAKPGVASFVRRAR